MEIHIFTNGRKEGPYSVEDLNSYFESGRLSAADLYWYQGCEAWKPLAQFPGFTGPVSLTQPPDPPVLEGDRAAAFLMSSSPYIAKSKFGCPICEGLNGHFAWCYAGRMKSLVSLHPSAPSVVSCSGQSRKAMRVKLLLSKVALLVIFSLVCAGVWVWCIAQSRGTHDSAEARDSYVSYHDLNGKWENVGDGGILTLPDGKKFFSEFSWEKNEEELTFPNGQRFVSESGKGGSMIPLVSRDGTLVAIARVPATQTGILHVYIKDSSQKFVEINNVNEKVAHLLKGVEGGFDKAAVYCLGLDAIANRTLVLRSIIPKPNRISFEFFIEVSRDGTLSLESGAIPARTAQPDAPPENVLLQGLRNFATHNASLNIRYALFRRNMDKMYEYGVLTNHVGDVKKVNAYTASVNGWVVYVYDFDAEITSPYGSLRKPITLGFVKRGVSWYLHGVNGPVPPEAITISPETADVAKRPAQQNTQSPQASTHIVPPETTNSTYCVTGVAESDMLNVRAGAGANYDIVRRLANGSGNIVVAGPSVMNGGTEWVPIRFRSQSGWVTKKHLKAE